jgi:hypothetical protein
MMAAGVVLGAVFVVVFTAYLADGLTSAKGCVTPTKYRTSTRGPL